MNERDAKEFARAGTVPGCRKSSPDVWVCERTPGHTVQVCLMVTKGPSTMHYNRVTAHSTLSG